MKTASGESASPKTPRRSISTRLKLENQRLKEELEEAKETLRAIQVGEVDALVVNSSEGPKVFTLMSADQPYRILVETMSEGAVTLAQDGTIFYCNRQFAEMVGCALDEVIGTSILRFFSAENRAVFREMLKVAKKSRTRVAIAIRPVSGASISAQLSMSAVEVDGRPGVCLIATDLTERMYEAERKRLYAFFNQLPAPMCIFEGREMRLTFANPAFDKFLKRNGLGKTLREIFGPEEYTQFVPLLEKVYDTGNPYIGKEVLLHLLDEKGEIQERWIEFGYYPLREEDGQIVGVLAFVYDVTSQVVARKKIEESEAKFRVMADTMPQIVWIADPSGGLVYSSRRWYDYTGFSVDDTLGYGWGNAVHPDDFGHAIRMWRESLSKESPLEIEYRLRRSDGTYRHHLVKGLPVRETEGGKIAHWLGTVTDLHDQKNTAEKFRQAVRARDELLSICSHELRTPVASMKLATQMFRRGLERNDPKATSPERVRRMVEQSDRQLDRLTRLIEEMLDFSRISGGTLQVSPEKVDLSELVDETLEQMESQFKGVCSEVKWRRPPSIVGDWDRFRLEQVITNLFTNAIKYGAGKPVEISLEKEGGGAFLRVRDEGIGIDEEDRERIFRPYERAVSVSNISGLGLGLYISSQIIRAHGGTIDVESARGRGSTFTVELPLNYTRETREERA